MSVDAALVRVKALRVNVVSVYEWPRAGRAVLEHSKAVVTLPTGIMRGEGSSREDAIVNALERAGVEL